MELQIKRLSTDAVIPSYGSTVSAGFDISSCEDKFILPHHTMLIKTGLSVQWSGPNAEEHYLRIAPRSGLAYKHGIFVNAGVIDFDYRGEIGIVIYNSSNIIFTIHKGDRIAQGIMERISRPMIVETNELNETKRGEGGFGSTGNN
jgi:dUTP pyrophosphatase